MFLSVEYISVLVAYLINRDIFISKLLFKLLLKKPHLPYTSLVNPNALDFGCLRLLSYFLISILSCIG